MSEAIEHFDQAVLRAEAYDLDPEVHIAYGLRALAVQIDRIERGLSRDGGADGKT